MRRRASLLRLLLRHEVGQAGPGAAALEERVVQSEPRLRLGLARLDHGHQLALAAAIRGERRFGALLPERDEHLLEALDAAVPRLVVDSEPAHLRGVGAPRVLELGARALDLREARGDVPVL